MGPPLKREYELNRQSKGAGKSGSQRHKVHMLCNAPKAQASDSGCHVMRPAVRSNYKEIYRERNDDSGELWAPRDVS